MGDTLRGHSSIEASLDVSLLVMREGLTNDISLVPTKVRGAEFKPLHAEFAFEHNPGTKQLKTARFWAREVKDTTSFFAVRHAITEALREHNELNQTQLIGKAIEAGITLSDSKIRERIKTMEVDGILNTDKGEKNATIYTLKSEN